MNRKEFLSYLRRRLWRYPKEETEEAIRYYDELISDKMLREGLSEYGAVASFGDKKQIVADLSSTMSGKQSGRTVLGNMLIATAASPLLFPLAIASFALIFTLLALYISLTVAFGAVALAGIVAAIGNWFMYADAGSSLMATGIGLVVFVVGSALCYCVAVYGGRLIAAAVRKIADSFTKRRNKESI